MAMLVALATAAAPGARVRAEDAPAPAVPPPVVRPAPGVGVPAEAKPAKPPVVESWPVETLDSLSRQREKLSEAIFELFEDVRVVSVEVGEGDVDLNVGRRVFDNHDALGSWTVVDRFEIELSYPLYRLEVPLPHNFTIGVTADGKATSEFINIRQVLPDHYQALTASDQRIEEVASSQWYKRFVAEGGGGQRIDQMVDDSDADQGAWVLSRDPEGGREDAFQVFDGLSKARYSRLWNTLVVPLRLPLKAAWADRLMPGEIISYTGSGTVETGPFLGWSPLPGQPLDDGEALISLKTFLQGDFRISIWRESEQYVQVKLSRLISAGRTFSAGAGQDDVLTGIDLVAGRLSGSAVGFKPFAYSLSKSKGKTFDLVYRYDLRQREARDAYEQAVTGRFDRSAHLAGGAGWAAAARPRAVEKVGKRDTDFDRSAKSSASRYGFLYRHYHNTSLTNSDIVLTLPEGTTRMFRSVADNSMRWRWVWGDSERLNHDYRINLDLDRLEQGHADAMTLTASGEIIDSETSGPEMHLYMDEIESAVNRPGFFPRPPKYRPEERAARVDPHAEFDRRRPSGGRWRRDLAIYYGRSSFYYQVTYDQRQVERFMATPPERMWPALELAFDVEPGTWATPYRRLRFRMKHALERALNLPLYALNIHFRHGSILEHAEGIHGKWLVAQASPDLRAKARALGQVFSNRLYGYELSRLLRAVLAEEKAAYLIEGTSHAFGQLSDRGEGAAEVDPLPERLQRRIDFERIGARPHADPAAAIDDQKIEVLDLDHFMLRFTVLDAQPPKALIFRLIERRPWKLPRIVAEQVHLNRDGLLKAGENALLIERHGGFLSRLVGAAVPGNRYELKMAYSRDGHVWGPISSAKFSLARFHAP